MQTLSAPTGLGDIFSDLASEATGAVTSEAQSIIIPVIAPYAIGLVLLSAAGLLFGVTAYKNVKRLRQELSLKKSQ